MKLKDSFILQKIDDEYIVVPTDSTLLKTGSMITLNETSAIIWQELEKGANVNDIALRITREFNIDTETAACDTLEFINILKEKDFLEE